MIKVYPSNLLVNNYAGLCIFLLSIALTVPLCAQNQKEIQFPGTDMYLTPPEHFEMTTNEKGESFLFHPGTNAVIQCITRTDIQWTELQALYDKDYFTEQGLNLLMKQDQELTNGTPATIFICAANYPDKSEATSTDYKVMIFTGGSNNWTFFVTARFPEIAADLLTNSIMNTFYSIHRNK